MNYRDFSMKSKSRQENSDTDSVQSKISFGVVGWCNGAE